MAINKTRTNSLLVIFCIIVMCLLSSCAGSQDAAGNIKQSSQQDYWPTESWKTKEPDPQKINVEQLATVEQTVSNSLVQSMVLVQDGYIISEYYKDGDLNRRYPVNSVTKSITSILVGIALDQGEIRGIDEKIEGYFPEYAKAFDSELKKSITLEHVLTMTSGLEWPEWTDWNFSIGPLWNAKDWNGFVLDRPMVSEPGVIWNYSTGGSQLLAAILKKRTGLSEYDYGMKYLFRPLGIPDVDWIPSQDGSSTGGFGLDMTARDLAKIGLLYLNGGTWDDKRIVSEKWVLDSTTVHSQGDYHFGEYGYHWWINEFDGHEAFFGMGYGGQYLVVVPDHKLVIVIFSEVRDAMDTVTPLEYIEGIVKACQ